MLKRIVTSATVAICAVAIAGAALGAPKLTVSQAEFDFGYVPQQSKVATVFWLKSTGEDTLRITNVVPGCGCTKTPLDKKVLAPGDSTRLEVIFSTKTYKRRVTKSPRIQTNEGAVNHRVKIAANVSQRPDSTYPLLLRPYKLDLSQFTEKEVREKTFTVTNVSDERLDLSLVFAASELFDAALPESLDPGQTATGSIRLTESAVGSSFEKSLTFEASDANKTRFTLPVKRTLRQPTTVSRVQSSR